MTTVISQNSNTYKESSITSNPISAIINEKTEIYNLENGEVNAVFYPVSVFHNYQGKWYDLISFADISTNSNTINISYLNSSLILQPYFVYQDSKISYNSMDAGLQNQINLNSVFAKNRHDFKFGSNFTNAEGITETGFDFIGNAVVTAEGSKIILDGVLAVDFADLIESNYTVTINATAIMIMNLKSGFNDLDPIVRFNSSGNVRDGEVQGTIGGTGSGTAATSNADTSKVGTRTDVNPHVEYRSFFSFNTSLPSNAVIQSANVSVKRSSVTDTCDSSPYDTEVYIGKDLVGSGLDVGDYSDHLGIGATFLETISYSANEYKTVNVSSTSLVNSTGYTDVIFKIARDYACYNGQEFESFYQGESVYMPHLDIIYKLLANETAGRQAIEEAIGSTINDSLKYSDQQIYSVNASSVHKLGKFDKVAVLGNQTWAFNYVTGSETFTGMTSMGNTLVVWENQLLSYDEIRGQVENLINSTKVL